jgi:putative transposase
VGWHVVKRGTRYAALEPIAMGLHDIYGGTQAGVARGLSLRMDHGTQYLSDHFLKQTRYWGINPSLPSSQSRKPMGSPKDSIGR